VCGGADPLNGGAAMTAAWQQGGEGGANGEMGRGRGGVATSR